MMHETFADAFRAQLSVITDSLLELLSIRTWAELLALAAFLFLFAIVIA